jgi:hypothetical protein
VKLISLTDAKRNNPEVILIGCRNHPEMIRHQSEYHCTTCGRRGADIRRETTKSNTTAIASRSGDL